MDRTLTGVRTDSKDLPTTSPSTCSQATGECWCIRIHNWWFVNEWWIKAETMNKMKRPEKQDVCGWDRDREKLIISLHFMWYFFSFLNWTDLGLHGSQQQANSPSNSTEDILGTVGASQCQIHIHTEEYSGINFCWCWREWMTDTDFVWHSQQSWDLVMF